MRTLKTYENFISKVNKNLNEMEKYNAMIILS